MQLTPFAPRISSNDASSSLPIYNNDRKENPSSNEMSYSKAITRAHGTGDWWNELSQLAWAIGHSSTFRGPNARNCNDTIIISISNKTTCSLANLYSTSKFVTLPGAMVRMRLLEAEAEEVAAVRVLIYRTSSCKRAHNVGSEVGCHQTNRQLLDRNGGSGRFRAAQGCWVVIRRLSSVCYSESPALDISMA